MSSAALTDLGSRLAAVSDRFDAHAERPVPERLTSPDPPSGERWDAGQVWAHLAEFIPYWIAEGRTVIAARSDAPVPFGRVKSDPHRVAAIERRRGEEIAGLRDTVGADILALRGFLDEVEAASAWERLGVHSTLGVMTVAQLVDEFLVGHLEQHAAQLDEIT